MNTQRIAFTVGVGLAIPVMWLGIGLLLIPQVRVALLVSVLWAMVGGVLAGYMVVQYLVHGQGLRGDITALTITCGLVAPLLALAWGLWISPREAQTRRPGERLVGEVTAVEIIGPKELPPTRTPVPPTVAPEAQRLTQRVTVQLPSRGTWTLTPVLLEPGATYLLKAETVPPGEFEVSVHLDDQPEASWPTPAGLHVAEESGFYLVTTTPGRLKYALQPHAPTPGVWTFTVEKTAVSAREHLEHRARPVYDASIRFGPQGFREPRG